jgi:hypothetical protein
MSGVVTIRAGVLDVEVAVMDLYENESDDSEHLITTRSVIKHGQEGKFIVHNRRAVLVAETGSEIVKFLDTD